MTSDMQNTRTMVGMTQRTRSRYLRKLMVLLIPLLVVAGPLDLKAQDGAQMVRTLVIKDNKVLIDGKPVDSEALPRTVDLSDLTVSYSFVGVDVPVVTIGKQFFAVRENRLEPIESRDEYRPVEEQRKRLKQKSQNSKGWIVDFDRGEYYTFQGERLEVDEAVPRLLQDANTLYLDELQKENEQLFSRLARERELEKQAALLATAARRARAKEERSEHVSELTQKLEEIFELKQQNRLDEIDRFESELEALKRRVEKREELKEEIIRSRVERLTRER